MGQLLALQLVEAHLIHPYILRSHFLEQLQVVVLEQVLVVARYLGLVCQAHSTFRAALMTQRLVRLLALVVI